MTQQHPIPPIKPQISYKEFQKLDLRIGRIVSAEDIPEADKLLRIKIDIGLEVRELISGIKGSYTPEEIIGKIVLVAVNIKPKKMRFGISHGMMLIATFAGHEEHYGRFIAADFGAAQEGMVL